MLKRFNLVVSTIRGREEDCISELWYFLKELGDDDIIIGKTGLPGLLVARTSLDPFYVVRELKRKACENPWYFRFILKIVPIQLTTINNIENIKEEALKLAQSMLDKKQKYRITIRKRLTDMRSENIIGAIAPNLENKVDLENPDKIIWIDIIGEEAGISILNPDDIVSLEIIRRKKRLSYREKS
ncbi:MAG: THUMP domain-containing protein [Thermoproteales archaeon]|nr:THUMP domain-containing protein [Thermoproteales archaeon]